MDNFFKNSIALALIGFLFFLVLVLLKGIYDGIWDKDDMGPHGLLSSSFEILENVLFVFLAVLVVIYYGFKYVLQFLLGCSIGCKLGELISYDIGRGIGCAIRSIFKGIGYGAKYIKKKRMERAIDKDLKEMHRQSSISSSSAVPICDDITNRNISFLLDGSNIIHWEEDTRGISLDILCSITDYLKSKGKNYFVLFDATAPHRLKENNKEDFDRFNMLLKSDPCFRVIPAGTRADEYLLEEARRDPQAVILTNDRYLDHYDKYPDVLDEGRQCVQHGMIMRNGDICFLDINLSIPITRSHPI